MRKDVKKAKEYVQNSITIMNGLMNQSTIPNQVKKKIEVALKNLEVVSDNMKSVENTYTNNI